ncbi:MAG: hypothetical protein ABH864_04770 [archaeon]
MRVKIVKRIPFEDLRKMIAEVPLMKPAADGSQIHPYRNAKIGLRQFSADHVNPPTFYLIRRNLEIQRALRSHLMADHGIDPLRLSGALEIRNENGEIWTLTPPIVEFTPRHVFYVPQPGELDHGQRRTRIYVPLICDGAHRVGVAREAGGDFIGVSIEGADDAYPYYAHPNGWGDVKIVDEVPGTMDEKKMYLLADSYALYRDFSRIGCGKPRHVGEGDKGG